MQKFNLIINTPENTFYNDFVTSINVDTSNGFTEILYGHMPIVIGLQPSVINITREDKQELVVNGEGFLQVADNVVTVFCGSAEWPHEIEINKVRKQIEFEERKLSEASSLLEYKLSKAALSRLFAKLKVK
mgnify:CR=1 FL=1